MIYTLTLNPALDRTIYVNRLEKNESIQVIREERYAGGKGIDVSSKYRIEKFWIGGYHVKKL